MSNSSVYPDRHAVELQDTTHVLAGAGVTLRDGHVRGEAANQTIRPRTAVHAVTEAPGRLQAPNLSISAWYAISGTAMA